MNVQLFREIQEAIRAEPEHFDMTMFFNGNPVTKCGTAACIGGWAVALGRLSTPAVVANNLTIHEAAQFPTIANGYLDITNSQGCQLYYMAGWPEDLRNEYYTARAAKEFVKQADVACRRIDRFLESNGVN